MSINEVRYLPECGSTNAYVKEHFEEFGPVGAVYTENQTAGRGRLGRSWVNAEGKALYYTVAIREPLAQPATLPLLASLAVRRQLQLAAHRQTGQQRQGGRLGQRLPDGHRIVQGLALGIHPAAAQTAAPGGLVFGIHGPHRTEFFKMLFHIGVGAAAFRQIAHLVDAHCFGTSLCS